MENWAAESYNLTAVPLEERHTAANIAKWPEAAKLDVPPEKIKAVKLHDSGDNVVAGVNVFFLFFFPEKQGRAWARRAGHSLKAAARWLVEHFEKVGRTRRNGTYDSVSRLMAQKWAPVTAALSDPAVTPRGKHYLELEPEQRNVIEQLRPAPGALSSPKEQRCFRLGRSRLRLRFYSWCKALKKGPRSPAFETAPVQACQTHASEQITARWQGLFLYIPALGNLNSGLLRKPRRSKARFKPWHSAEERPGTDCRHRHSRRRHSNTGEKCYIAAHPTNAGTIGLRRQR